MPLDNFNSISPLLYRSAQPDLLGFKTIKSLDVKIVCKLSRDDEFPNSDEVRLLGGINVMINDHFSQIHPDRNYVEALVNEIHNAISNNHKVLIHCMKGRDRTGLLAGAYQIIKMKLPIDDVMDEFNSYGTTPISYLTDINIRSLLKSLASSRV